MKSEIEQALLVLEHTERSTLVDCGADKRIRQLFKPVQDAKAQDFDKSEMSPTKLAKLSHNQGRSALLGAEFCDGSCARPVMWKRQGQGQGADLRLSEGALRAETKSLESTKKEDPERGPRYDRNHTEQAVPSSSSMCWTLSRLSAMGGEGVAYEHGRRLKVSEAKGLTPKPSAER